MSEEVTLAPPTMKQSICIDEIISFNPLSHITLTSYNPPEASLIESNPQITWILSRNPT